MALDAYRERLYAREGEGGELVEVYALAICREELGGDGSRVFSDEAETKWFILLFNLVAIRGDFEILETVQHLFGGACVHIINVGLQRARGGVDEGDSADVARDIQSVGGRCGANPDPPRDIHGQNRCRLP